MKTEAANKAFVQPVCIFLLSFTLLNSRTKYSIIANGLSKHTRPALLFNEGCASIKLSKHCAGHEHRPLRTASGEQSLIGEWWWVTIDPFEYVRASDYNNIKETSSESLMEEQGTWPGRKTTIDALVLCICISGRPSTPCSLSEDATNELDFSTRAALQARVGAQLWIQHCGKIRSKKKDKWD